MFEASHPFLFFDYFRIPYRVNRQTAAGNATTPSGFLKGCSRLATGTTQGQSPSLYWPPPESSAWPQSWCLGPNRFLLEGSSFFAKVVRYAVTARHLSAAGEGWRPTQPIYDTKGTHVASVWRDAKGDVFLPFDPSEAITNIWSESYRTTGSLCVSSKARRLALRSYYRLRPLMPRPVQIALRRILSRVQARSRFPGWPVETALHDLYGFLFRCVADIARRPVPWISTWPNPYSWLLVLTHDVETLSGYRNIPALREVEFQAGYRSAWNFVPRRYEVEDAVVQGLLSDGFEVGVHGLYHDGRDLESLTTLEERLPALRHYAQRWQAGGFRSPATLRVWEWMPLLGFEYDSSYPDSDPFEPQAGGCCSLLPFFNQDLVELPITIPQDHTLFIILGHEDESLWIDKIEHVKRAQGMALVLTHPDYLVKEPLLSAYENILGRYSSDSTAWRALPREVSAWWRRRAASHLQWMDDAWKVVGPAAPEASVSYAQPN